MDAEPLPLIDAIEAFIGDHAMSPVTFGRKALNDPHFVAQLRKGRRVWPDTEQRVRSFMQRAEQEAA
jgi:2,4-dienoyl-CoA reductase-like NADH-dependent reductase (Old Yellow Enzyme family)